MKNAKTERPLTRRERERCEDAAKLSGFHPDKDPRLQEIREAIAKAEHERDEEIRRQVEKLR